MEIMTIDAAEWLPLAEKIKAEDGYNMNYLRNLSGVDYETHLEVVYHFINVHTQEQLTVKVTTSRDEAVVPSVAHLWPTADWNEREAYDLLGIIFTGHPNLSRIMMADDWVGHPLRKDYVPLDPEV